MIALRRSTVLYCIESYTFYRALAMSFYRTPNKMSRRTLYSAHAFVVLVDDDEAINFGKRPLV